MKNTAREHLMGGFALPAAVFALVIVGVLVTGGFYLARQETRIGIASERSTLAFYLAERGTNEVLSQWDVSTFGALSNWGTATVTDTTDEGIWSVNVTRMTSKLYFLLASGLVNAGSGTYGNASRMLGVVVRFRTANLYPDAALTTIGELKFGGSAQIFGQDYVPPAWTSVCDAPGPPKPGVFIDDEKNIKYTGGTKSIDGDPPILEDVALTPDDLLEFGDMFFNDLVGMATNIYPPGATVTQLHPDSAEIGGSWVCNSSVRDNWGDPENPMGACGNHFPIIYASGDLRIAASDPGQGILLVEGNLEVSGGHEFFGPVIVKGTLTTTGTGGHFIGGTIAANVSLESSTVLGDAIVQYSACTVKRAVLNNSSLTRARPLENRSWVDLSSTISG